MRTHELENGTGIGAIGFGNPGIDGILARWYGRRRRRRRSNGPG